MRFNSQLGRVQAICVALAAITFAVFWQTSHFSFIDLDDGEYVFGNPFVARGLTLTGVKWAFTHTYSSNWHPLTWISHMLDCQIYGLNAGGHHLTNVIIHTATVIALFLVLRNMTGMLWRSAFVAAVFAIHPLRAESVAWVSERKDVLCGLFFILTVGAYVRYARQRSAARYGLVMLLFALGLMSKPMLVTLPVVLLLLDYWPLQRQEPVRKLILEKLPLLALSAASCAVTLLAQRGAIRSTEAISLPLRLANAMLSYIIYLRQMVWPARLAAFYPFHHGLLVWKIAVAAILLAGISALAVWQRRSRPWLLTGWLWYVVMLLPVVGIIQAGDQAHADRFTYLPQIGIYMALTWLAAEWRMDRAALGCLMAGVIAVLMCCAWKQTTYWQNNETLSTRALACTGDNYVAHTILGNYYLKEKDPTNAITQFQEALQAKPGFAKALNNLGNALAREGKLDEAIGYLQQALKSDPHYADAHYNLGLALWQKGKLDDAITEFQKALEINPAHAAAHNNLGSVLCQSGRTDEGIAQFRLALQINPAMADADNNLGNALMMQGKVDEAIGAYRRALAINPNYAAAQKNLEKAVLQK